MAIINNAEIWFCKLDPKRPNAAFNKKAPTWELQIRTTDPEYKKYLDGLNLNTKLIIHKDGEKEGEPVLTEDGKKQWRVNLKKPSKKSDGTPAAPVKVVNGSLEDIDPNTIGNGSIANVRVFQYEYSKEGKGGKKEEGIASMLMAVQLKKHIVYHPKPREDDFEMTETETVQPPDPEEDDESDSPEDEKF